MRAISVRQAAECAGDRAAVERMWRAVPGAPRREVGDAIADRVAGLLRSPSVVILVAHREADVGFIVLSLGPRIPPLGEEAMCIEYLYVDPQARRMGIAQALVARAAAVAEQRGIRFISTNVPAADRIGQRFFARLGFRPSYVRRVVAVAALRRRLAPAAPAIRELTVQRRRTERARSGAAALRP
ncbi:MAG: GNAT family N-acetyltransferase [Angustibacter sp.]